MKQLYHTIAAFAFIGIVGCQPHGIATNPSPREIQAPTSRSLQVILVVTDDWDAVPGVMRRFQRDGVRAPWHSVGREVPVVVGAAGLGWGDGLHGIGSPGGNG